MDAVSLNVPEMELSFNFAEPFCPKSFIAGPTGSFRPIKSVNLL